jgi:hypothetical protein
MADATAYAQERFCGSRSYLKMRICMTTSFWTEGPGRLRKALEDRRAELEQLAAQLRTAKDDEERERLERQIIRLLEEYAPSEQEIEQSLFLLR